MPGVKIHLEMLKVVDVLGLFWLTCFFNFALPDELHTEVVVHISKKMEQIVFQQFLSIPGEVYSKVLEVRLNLRFDC